MNEDELRTALHDGEGDAPDADAAIGTARRRARQRRTRIATTAGTAAGVLFVAGAIAVLAGTRDDPDHQTSHGGPPAGAAIGGSSPSAAGAACPASFPQTVQPGGTASSATLLPGDVDTVLVCGYGSTGLGAARPASLTLTGTDARRLAASLNAAPTSRPKVMCPQYRRADNHRLTFLAVVGGRTSDPVSTTLGDASCSVVVTSPSATRYGWAPPQDLQARLFALHP